MQKQVANVLYLIPIPIADSAIDWSIPLNVKNEIVKIQTFIVENAKTSRHYLKQLNPLINWSEITILELDKHKGYEQNEEIIDIMKKGGAVGLMSESGMPCIADPGHNIVAIAQDSGWKVKPLVGPSSILLALISSGMNGQCFKFNGYLPNQSEDRRKSIQLLEKEAQVCTQLFIEAPYRNDKMFQDLIQVLNSNTRLLVAIDINGENETIISRKISYWKTNSITIGKVPCLFGIGR